MLAILCYYIIPFKRRYSQLIVKRSTSAGRTLDELASTSAHRASLSSQLNDCLEVGKEYQTCLKTQALD